jgi:UDP-glucose 4-epimerase
VDLALGHLAALRKIRSGPEGFCTPVNLGTGRGVSVLDLVRGMEAASGQAVPYTVVARRPGDVATCYCDPSRAEALLGWTATRGVADMCADSWKWQSNNPKGYEVAEGSSSAAPKYTGE